MFPRRKSVPGRLTGSCGFYFRQHKAVGILFAHAKDSDVIQIHITKNHTFAVLNVSVRLCHER